MTYCRRGFLCLLLYSIVTTSLFSMEASMGASAAESAGRLPEISREQREFLAAFNGILPEGPLPESIKNLFAKVPAHYNWQDFSTFTQKFDVDHLALNPDGTTLAFLQEGFPEKIHFVNTCSGMHYAQSEKIHVDCCTPLDCSFTPDGLWLITWHLVNHRFKYMFWQNNNGEVVSSENFISHTPQPWRLLVTTGKDDIKCFVHEHTEEKYYCFPDNSCLANCSQNGLVKVFRGDNLLFLQTPNGHFTIPAVPFTTVLYLNYDGSLLCIGTQTAIHIHDFNIGTHTIIPIPGGVDAISLSKDQRILAVSSRKNIYLWKHVPFEQQLFLLRDAYAIKPIASDDTAMPAAQFQYENARNDCAELVALLTGCSVKRTRSASFDDHEDLESLEIKKPRNK